MVTRTASASEPPAASATALRFSNARRVWASMSPPTSCMLAGSSGICPERYTVSPTRTACEYGPIAAGALSLWMISRLIGAYSSFGQDRAAPSAAAVGIAVVVAHPLAAGVRGYGTRDARYVGHA